MRIKLKINGKQDRDNMVVALANNGYEVVVTNKPNNKYLIANDFFVEFDYEESEE